jgi:predicted nuclease of restriction endonuclease-like (RecB) superfamily
MKKLAPPSDMPSANPAYEQLIHAIGQTLQAGRVRAYRVAEQVAVQTRWEIGRHIVEFEQHGSEKAEYGSYLLDRLAKDLTLAYGKGFTRTNVVYIRKLFLTFPIGQTLSDQLSWSHYCELLTIENDLERSFYEQQSIRERWSLSELKRQKKSALFLRLAHSRDKEGILKLAREGQIQESPEDIVRDPYVLEFLQIPEQHRYSESELESRIIERLQTFLLELGKGFAFIGRQYRITIANRHYHVDLVFYHRILKCFVLFDLKINELEHGDVGQMNLYLNYFKKEENMPDDNEPVGFILTAHKDDILVEFALGGLTNQIFVSKYQLYLPDRAMLEQKVRRIMEDET